MKANGALRPVLIGLTGPIGCGKSTVAGWLAERGAVVVDADQVAREVTSPGEPALEAVILRFGHAVRHPDGGLDRAALGRVAFSDPAALADLEAIIHPAVRPRILAAIEAASAAGAPAVVVEAIKLVEGGLAALCDEVWLVACSPGRQRARMAARGDDPAAIEQRISAQGDLVSRLRPAVSRVIVTDDALDEVEGAVAAAYARALAGPRPGPG